MGTDSSDILDQWLNLKDNQPGEVTKSSITKAPVSDFYHVSQGQKRLWLIHQNQPNSPVYNYAEIWTFHDSSFVETDFVDWIETLPAKHTILTGNFFLNRENLAMKMHNNPGFLITKHDGKLNYEESKRWLKNEASKPFDLKDDSLLRIFIVPQDNNTVRVGLVLHHIIMDAWSMDIIRKDFIHNYLLTQDSDVSYDLPSEEDRLQFTDYAHWEKNIKKLKEEEGSVPEQSDLKILNIPTDYSRPGTPSFKGEIVRFNLPEILCKKLDRLQVRYQTTPFNIFLAAYNILLSKYSQENTIAIGIPVLNRELEEFQSTVGYFVDTQVTIVPIDKEKNFEEFLSAVKSEVLDAVSGKKINYEQLLDQSTFNDRGINPIFQTMFVGHAQAENPFIELGLNVEFEILDLDVAKFDLTLHLFEKPGGAFEIGIEYSADLFSRNYAERLFNHFTTLLEAICDNPEQAIGNYSLIDQDEYKYLTTGINEGFNPSSDGFIIDDIVKNFDTHPQAPAVVCGDAMITYRELDFKSRIVANKLAELNVDREFPVAIYMNRSVEFVIAIVGILRYGGYYLPLDPEYPNHRIQQYTSDSGAAYMISDNTATQHNFDKSVLKDIRWENLEWNAENPDDFVCLPEQRSKHVYLIFTSGSTNNPKGVPVNQSNLYSSNQARIQYYDNDPKGFLLLSSFSFDSSIAGLFWSLSTGGKLVISQKDEHLDTRLLLNIIETEEVTHALLLPSLYHTLLDSLNRTMELPLECVIVAGEECSREIIDTHFTKVSSARLFNEYGPTEGTVWCVVQELESGMGSLKVPIGLPVSNSLVYILDQQRNVTPLGLLGELYIGGSGVVDGYTSSHLNENKFSNNPFRKNQGQLYKTGDLVRLQEDGLIEYHGRVDNQIKLRGYRIELEEIEDLAVQFSGIVSAKALAVNLGKKEREFIALFYINEEDVQKSELKQFLGDKLPNYMVPGYLQEVEDFPKLPNGKTDNGSLMSLLPTEEPENIKKASSFFEKRIANIWGQVLGMEEVPVNQDFFELGGNSLQSIRIIALCRDEGYKVTPEQFLRYSTIESLVLSLHLERYERPGNLLELKILRIWEKHLRQKLIGVNENFIALGGTNSDWTKVLRDITEQVGLVPGLDIEMTIHEISDKAVGFITDKNLLINKLRRVIPIKTSGTQNPLFCIHSEFYYESVYSKLTRKIPDEYPVYGILSVSPELIKDHVPDSIEEIASLCIEEIKKIQPEGPYKCLSYSIGNVVSFEIARQLIDSGESVKLFMIDPPIFFHPSRSFKKESFQKLKYYVSSPKFFLDKVQEKLTTRKKTGVLVEEVGLLKKYLKEYTVEPIECEAVIIATAIRYKKTYGWDPLVDVLEKTTIEGPHNKLLFDPYASQMSEVITRNLLLWDNKSEEL